MERSKENTTTTAKTSWRRAARNGWCARRKKRENDGKVESTSKERSRIRRPATQPRIRRAPGSVRAQLANETDVCRVPARVVPVRAASVLFENISVTLAFPSDTACQVRRHAHRVRQGNGQTKTALRFSIVRVLIASRGSCPMQTTGQRPSGRRPSARNGHLIIGAIRSGTGRPSSVKRYPPIRTARRGSIERSLAAHCLIVTLFVKQTFDWAPLPRSSGRLGRR